MGCCGSSAKGDVAAHSDDPERETSAFTPQKLKLLRETLSPPRREKRGSACGRACKALFLITLVAAAAFSGAAAAGSFDSFCLGAAPLPKRGSSRAPMVESRAEAAVGLRSGEAFCSAVDVGRTAVGIGRKGLGYLPPLPAFITRRVPAPVLKLWDWVAGGFASGFGLGGGAAAFAGAAGSSPPATQSQSVRTGAGTRRVMKAGSGGR